ncbi:MAG: RluA family pseudouridine synthase [Eubacteriales bacterium]|nr:RluA family pseudouridine synthase [Eubacteriales bacterium]
MNFSWLVTTTQEGKRLEQVLRTECGFSRRQLIRLKYQGEALINGKPALTVARLQTGDQVQVTVSEHLEPLPPQDIPLDILFEDEDLLILNKPPGLVSHPTKGYPQGTLANALSFHWQQKGEERPARLVTRLDKDTSGLVLAAKTAWSHYRLSEIGISKQYYGITRGIPNPLAGEIDQPIGRLFDNPSKRGVNPPGKSALTRYQTEKAGNNLALVKLAPITGRTHQLRIHMAWLGCPLLDDYLYGREEGILGRTALHAFSLKFRHPANNEYLEFTAPLPTDMRAVVANMERI